jgi:hypothetical protein
MPVAAMNPWALLAAEVGAAATILLLLLLSYRPVRRAIVTFVGSVGLAMVAAGAVVLVAGAVGVVGVIANLGRLPVILPR